MMYVISSGAQNTGGWVQHATPAFPCRAASTASAPIVLWSAYVTQDGEDCFATNRSAGWDVFTVDVRVLGTATAKRDTKGRFVMNVWRRKDVRMGSAFTPEIVSATEIGRGSFVIFWLLLELG